jgi:hypothetical protein
MEKKGTLLGSRAVKAAITALAVIGAVGSFLFLRNYLGQSPAGAASADRVFMCAETGKSFNYTLRRGDTLPVRSPHSGRNTGYPAELCNWTPSGGVSDTFTPVLLNSVLGKSDPTFCPTCGRLVVPHNPPADPNRKPPPTRAEYRPSTRGPERND